MTVARRAKRAGWLLPGLDPQERSSIRIDVRSSDSARRIDDACVFCHADLNGSVWAELQDCDMRTAERGNGHGLSGMPICRTCIARNAQWWREMLLTRARQENGIHSLRCKLGSESLHALALDIDMIAHDAAVISQMMRALHAGIRIDLTAAAEYVAGAGFALAAGEA